MFKLNQTGMVLSQGRHLPKRQLTIHQFLNVFNNCEKNNPILHIIFLHFDFNFALKASFFSIRIFYHIAAQSSCTCVLRHMLESWNKLRNDDAEKT